MKAADAVVFAQRIHTLDPQTTGATALAVTDGRITAVGTPQDIERHRGPGTRTLDYRNATIVPGLNDSHTHVVFGLELARGIQLTDLGPLTEVQRIVGDAARKTKPGDWVIAWGLDPNIFNSTGFNGRLFDDATEDVPMFLRMRDGHSAIVNSAALAAAGITGPVEFPDESLIDVDDDGRPTGYIVEFSALDLVGKAIPQEPFAVRVERLGTLLHEMAGVGIASTHVLDFVDGSAELATALETKGELPVRLRFSPMVNAGAGLAELERIADLQGTGGRRWRVEGVKFFIDGTIDNGSAWLEEPDIYGENNESVWTDPGDFQKALRFFVERGIPTATHAIGDQGVRYVLDALAAAGPDRCKAAHRIEHIETIPDDVVERFAELGVAASMQPIHGTHHTRADRSDNWSVRLGEERASRGWRCRDLREAGVTLALGSDWPITPYDPRAMMADSILRRPVEHPETQPVQPEQALTVLMALEGYTTHAAAAAGLQSDAGSISVGKRADLTVFECDPLSLDPEELPRARVITTLLDGLPTH
ncbi:MULTISPECIES: amidohydrolase [Arthrobacter]|uniref:Amidohydrolase n=1 Tax=Arthrobacter terricola TaxID=2547396 RepID=A0A4R5KY62_9MICC|nr:MULTISPECIES: amidohydrolase [Arthrobacter]MBT8160322.1 amidohydrolase [Arthrobacter sp. GN70]TDF99980.1 amidohydrolase [Arthrobacter terricola]